MAKTLAEKVWDAHVVRRVEGEPDLLYIDLHLIHEVTSAQAFDGLRDAGRVVRRPDLTLATEDHNVPTFEIDKPIADPISRAQVDALRRNAAEFGVPIYSLGNVEQGIVHVVGPQLGLTQPGMTVVCGDSHTATHGAFGALAFGIGTSEVEHVLATQTLPQRRPKTMRVRFEGMPGTGVGAKDLILGLIAQETSSGATNHVVEYDGEAIRALSMEGRMTVSNMSIEWGARAGLIAPDETTYRYLEGRPGVQEPLDRAIERWSHYVSDDDASFDRELEVDASALAPQLSWGTNPGQTAPITGLVPTPTTDDEQRALDYMGLTAGQSLLGQPVDIVFIGSCTNSRISDLRQAASVLDGRRVAAGTRLMIVPGSQQVKAQAEREGLADIFKAAGADWRESGCSMCLGMNPDIAGPKERVASTSNRNFEGRQGRLARTHLMSPEMAAAAAIAGCLVDVRELA